MAYKKTAISIENHLFEQIEALAEEMDVSRSFVFSMAAREFIEHYKSQKLLEALNDAHKDAPGVNEERLKAQMKSRHHHLVKDQW